MFKMPILPAFFFSWESCFKLVVSFWELCFDSVDSKLIVQFPFSQLNTNKTLPFYKITCLVSRIEIFMYFILNILITEMLIL